MVKIYVEGGGNPAANSECREGFKKLWQRCGLGGRLPRVIPCGSRSDAYNDFVTALSDPDDNILLLVDSEDPISDIEKTWEHLNRRDGWAKPEGAEDQDALFMTTCMETWLVADRATLKSFFGSSLQENALPPLNDLESRTRGDVQSKLRHATRNCPGPYKKGKKSFQVLGKLDPQVLEEHLPSFERALNILDDAL